MCEARSVVVGAKNSPFHAFFRIVPARLRPQYKKTCLEEKATVVNTGCGVHKENMVRQNFGYFDFLRKLAKTFDPRDHNSPDANCSSVFFQLF
jgi:hypothetical protein